MLVCALSTSIAHETAGAARAPAFPAPSFFGGTGFHEPGHCAAGSRTRVACANAKDQMPRHRRLDGKLPTHDGGEKGRTRHDVKRRGHRRIFFERAFMPHRFLPSLLLAFVLFPSRAWAQTGAAPKPPAPASADALTPEQAKRALETLQDDAKRAQIIETMRPIAK